jgi:hypothetical protein
MQGDPFRRGIVRRDLVDVALIDLGPGDAVAGRVLDVGGQPPHRGPIAHVGRDDVQGEQVAQLVDAQMHLQAAFSLGSVIYGTGAALG